MTESRNGKGDADRVKNLKAYGNGWTWTFRAPRCCGEAMRYGGDSGYDDTIAIFDCEKCHDTLEIAYEECGEE